MCGIFGILVGTGNHCPGGTINRAVDKLFKLSESRGKEAAGMAIRLQSGIRIFKQPLSASDMIQTPTYKGIWREISREIDGGTGRPFALIGHSRLVTNGLQGVETNNQPVAKKGVVGVHNGIVVNDAELWRKYPEMTRRWEVDTEVIMSLLRLKLGETADLGKAFRSVFGELKGAASVGVLFDDLPYFALATNTGSMYVIRDEQRDLVVFTSERYILAQFLREGMFGGLWDEAGIQQLAAGNALLFSIEDRSAIELSFSGDAKEVVPSRRQPKVAVADFSRNKEERREALARCTQCVLPETFPGISFDTHGVCNFCRDHAPMQVAGKDALQAMVEPYRRPDGGQDCVVAFSGGRDSSYMLHYVKNELGMNPIAYSYDWGMVTDIARRNQARLTGQLGVEHVVISADIRRKRKNIQRNINAWLKRPSLGVIPLFMAGDKQYFYFAKQMRQQTGIDLVFLGGNPLEKTGFKTAFAGVTEVAGGRTYDISMLKKLRMAAYYAKAFVTNPGYLNRSLLDTAFAYYSSYMMKHDFAWLFRYITWDEDEIDRVLREQYDWEVAADTDTTWRIGDGTAAFYNYIYYTVAGFSENDTLRSNQIREGMIGRDEALAFVRRDNQPRYETMREYAYQVGFDLDEALFVINSMPTLY